MLPCVNLPVCTRHTFAKFFIHECQRERKKKYVQRKAKNGNCVLPYAGRWQTLNANRIEYIFTLNKCDVRRRDAQMFFPFHSSALSCSSLLAVPVADVIVHFGGAFTISPSFFSWTTFRYGGRCVFQFAIISLRTSATCRCWALCTLFGCCKRISWLRIVLKTSVFMSGKTGARIFAFWISTQKTYKFIHSRHRCIRHQRTILLRKNKIFNEIVK